MHFERKPETCEQILNTKIPLLKSNSALDIIPPTASNRSNPHLLVEGENLHVLMAFQQTHKEAIDLIYIDPPYNTGNKDFTYNDKFVDKEDGYRHSKWLSFMEKRLKLAKELLKDTGVIFISIDENEQANLKLLCDQIFGEHNYIENFIWIKNSSKNNSKTTGCVHEYVVCYAKSIKEIANLNSSFRLEKSGFAKVMELYKSAVKAKLEPSEIELKLKAFYKSNLDLKGISQYCWVDKKGIYQKDNASAPGGNGTFLDLKHPNGQICPNPTGGYRWKKETAEQHLKNNLIAFGPDHTTIPRFKRYLDSVETEVVKSVFENFSDGKKELQEIFTKSPFDFPKPTTLIKHILKMLPDSTTILDFFGGSGTTLHATMALNAEDGGNRQCILVTNNEGTFEDPSDPDNSLPGGIFDNVTYPRIKKVSEGYLNSKGAQISGLNQAVRVFGVSEKLKSFIHKDYPIKGLIENSIETLLLKAGVYFSELCNHEFDFMDETSTIKIFKNSIASSSYVVISSDDLSDHEIEKVINHIIEKYEDYKINVYKVKLEEDDSYLEETFKENSNIIFEDMPDIIRNAFKLANQAKKED